MFFFLPQISCVCHPLFRCIYNLFVFFIAPTPEDDIEDVTKDSESPGDASSDSSKKDSSYPEIRYVDGLRSVLLLQKRKGPKKVLKWKTDLESIRYFELDETERVNVTKTFTDMKQIEKQNEREAFQMARKLRMYILTVYNWALLDFVLFFLLQCDGDNIERLMYGCSAV